jgi:hypothetical protein
MKTTIEISDELFAQSRKFADRHGLTLRALVEEGLRLALKARAVSDGRTFSLPTFGTGGLTDGYSASGLHRAILDSYGFDPAEQLGPAPFRSVHDRPRR